MLKKICMVTVGGLTAVMLVLIMTVGASHAQEPSPTENFVFVNYIGQELFLDLDDVTYTVPGTDTMPEGGKLTLQLNPGEHKFAANVPGVIGEAGEFTLTTGETIAKAARLDQTPPSIGPDGILLAKPKAIVDVFDFDPNAQPVDPAPTVDVWQPVVPATDQAGIVWINYIGDELTVDLNGELYKVSPSTEAGPGRLQIDVVPGDYTYTASVPGGSLNNRLTLQAGQVVGLNFTGIREEQEYEVGEEYDFLLNVEMQVAQEDLTSQAVAAVEQPAIADDAVPSALLVGDEMASEPATAEGLLVKNYAGETLTFTINDQAYTVPDHDQITIDLPPGSYTFTASRPYVATTGTVDMQPGQSTELSVAINVAGDAMAVYQN